MSDLLSAAATAEWTSRLSTMQSPPSSTNANVTATATIRLAMAEGVERQRPFPDQTQVRMNHAREAIE
jgi:hypothetical protein